MLIYILNIETLNPDLLMKKTSFLPPRFDSTLRFWFETQRDFLPSKLPASWSLYSPKSHNRNGNVYVEMTEAIHSYDALGAVKNIFVFVFILAATLLVYLLWKNSSPIFTIPLAMFVGMLPWYAVYTVRNLRKSIHTAVSLWGEYTRDLQSFFYLSGIGNPKGPVQMSELTSATKERIDTTLTTFAQVCQRGFQPDPDIPEKVRQMFTLNERARELSVGDRNLVEEILRVLNVARN